MSEDQVKKPIWKRWWFWGIVIVLLIGIFAGGEDNNTNNSKVVTTSSSHKYDLEFKPDIKTSCTEDTITVNAEINCPDGAIMQVLLMSGDLKEMYSDKPIVKNGQISSVFKLENTDPKNYAGTIMFQFNAKDLPQPDNVKKVYGTYGEKLEGDNTIEANFGDGSKGKNASVTFTVPYPSQEAVEQRLAQIFEEFTSTLIKNSNGVILDIDRPSSGIYHVMVSNSAWYLSSENEKQYFAEEMLKTFTQVGKSIDGTDTIVLTIFDESMNEVARSKVLGGMKIKR